MLNRITLTLAACIAFVATSSMAQEAQSNSGDKPLPFIPVADYCRVVVSNPTLMRFSKVAAIKGVDWFAQLVQLDAKTTAWIDEKLKAANVGNPDALNDYMADVRKTCGKELVDSDFSFMDGGYDLTRAEQVYKQCKSEAGQDCSQEAEVFYRMGTRSLILPKALAFNGGDKVLADAAKESIEQLEADAQQCQARYAIAPNEFGFKQYKIGMAKSEIKNLGQCQKQADGVELCEFDKKASVQLAPLATFGIKTTIGGQDAIISHLVFLDGKLIAVYLALPVPNPSFVEGQQRPIIEAITAKYGEPTDYKAAEWVVQGHPNLKVIRTAKEALGSVNGRAVRVASFLIAFYDSAKIDEATNRKNAVAEKAEAQRKQKSANDM